LARVLQKIKNCELEPIVEIVHRFPTENEAFEKEKELIKEYGRRDLGTGTLCNLTDGGDGVRGFTYTEKHREMFKQMWRDDRVRKARVGALRNFYQENPELASAHSKSMLAGHNQEVKARIKANSKAAISTPEVREKIRTSLQKYYQENPEALARLSDQGKKGKGKKLSKETREKMSAAKKLQYQNPEFRKRWKDSTFSLEAENKRAGTRAKTLVSKLKLALGD
jgi:hypothetical protein